MSLAASAPVAFVLTRDPAAARAFYEGVLGLRFVVDDGFAAVFELAGGTLRVTPIADHVAAPHPVLGWNVKDIVATVDALVARGVQFTTYPGLGQDERGIWTSPDGKARVAFFGDPDGNGLSLTQS